jgi:nicotinamidase-related amidase
MLRRLVTMSRALVVIDVQESFRQRPTWQAMGNQQIADQVSRLVDAARTAGDPVIWVLHAEPGSGTVFDPVRGYVKLIDGLAAREDEPQIVKTSANAFTTTNLHQQLTQRHVREVTICGIRTEQCCETTARVASDLGYAVTFVTDATTTSAIPHPDAPTEQTVAELLADPRTMSAADVIERTERVLAAREFATIATTDEMVGLAGAVAR